jgi:hypothetical protein
MAGFVFIVSYMFLYWPHQINIIAGTGIMSVNIMKAVIHGDEEAITAWLSRSEHYHQYSENRMALLLSMAAAYGRTTICKLLIVCWDLDVEIIVSALKTACSRGHVETAQLLLNYCGDAQHLDDTLVDTAARGEMEVVLWLLDALNLSITDRIRWKLVTASACNDVTSARKLASHVGL